MAVSRPYTAVFMLLAAIFPFMIHPSHAHARTTTTKRNPSLSSEHHFHSFLDHHHHQDSQSRYQNHHHVIGSRFLFDSITTTSRRHARILQQDPDVNCEAWQNFTQAWDCSCQRFEVDGVRVNCSYIETQCNQDNSYCYDGYYDIVLNNQSQAQVVTSCINVVNAVSATAATDDEPPQDICVRIFPTAPGDFSTIESCSATLNEEVCNFCSPCSPEDAAAAAAATNNNSNNQTSGSASNSTNNAAVTINCCNVQVDMIQTCGAVSAGGAMTPIFDVIDPSAQGKCTGTMSPPSSSSSRSYNNNNNVFATSVVVGLVLLLTTITMS